jgi:Concanavalin A-like lectin/glucanases superfamily
MTAQTLAPSAIAASTNLTGAVADVDEAIGTVPVNFNGSTYLIRGGGLTGLADGQIVLLSVFFRVAGGAGVERRIMTIRSGATASRFTIAVNVNNNFLVIGRSSVPADVINVTSTGTFAVGAAWHHALFGFDLANSANRALYIDGVLDSTPTYNTYSATNIDLAPTSPETLIGTYEGTLSWNGDIANLFFHTPAAYVAPSTVLSKFIDASGVPVYMGADGSLPLGLQPLLCMSNQWPNNDGSGGNFTIGAGALTTGTAPVDV